MIGQMWVLLRILALKISLQIIFIARVEIKTVEVMVLPTPLKQEQSIAYIFIFMLTELLLMTSRYC